MSESNERVEALRSMLKNNGEAGTVECHPDGSPEYQHFVTQAGPFDPGTPVVVLGKEDVDQLLAALAQPSGSESLEMRACEIDRLVLHMNQPYIFTADPDCKACQDYVSGVAQPSGETEEDPSSDYARGWKCGHSDGWAKAREYYEARVLRLHRIMEKMETTTND